MARERMSIQEFVYRAKTFLYLFEPQGFDKADFTRGEWREIQNHSGEECRLIDLAMEDQFEETGSYKENFDSCYWNIEFEDGYVLDAVQGVSLKEAGRDTIAQDEEDLYIRKSIEDDEELANLRAQAELHKYSPEFESLMENLSLDSLEKYLEKNPDFRLIKDFEYTYADDPIFDDAEGDELSLDDVENAGWLKGYEVWLPAGLNFKFEGPISNKGGLGYINFRLPSINKVITFNTDYSNLKEFFSFTDTGLDKHFDETAVDDLKESKKNPEYVVIGFDLYDNAQEVYGCTTREKAEELARRLNQEQEDNYGADNPDTYEYAVELNDGSVVDICTTIDEALTEEKSDDIKQFIQDLYNLRKTSIEEEGEYGLGNLVFKEFRNKGYLDNLKDQRKVEKGKELSLEKMNEAVLELKDVVRDSYNACLGILGNRGEIDKLPTAAMVAEDIVDNYDGYGDIDLSDPKKYNNWVMEVAFELNSQGLDFADEDNESLNENMEDKVKRTTKDFTKEHGQIMCNDGEQKEEVVKLLKDKGYEVEVNPSKKGSVSIKYTKTKKENLKEDGSMFKNHVKMSKEDFNKWKEATKEDVELKDTDFGTLVYIKGSEGPKHIGTYLNGFEELWCDDINLFGHELKEVWTNGSGPGFYEPIDYIYRDLDDADFEYEMFQDEEKTYFIVDEANSNEMQEIVLKQCGDYEVEGPDPTGKVSIVVDNKQLYID